MYPQQRSLFSQNGLRPFNYPFPSTRYQGSKRSLVDWIWENVQHLPCNTVLDVFGGTGAVSHLFKNAGKQVTYNDVLSFNRQVGIALIENNEHTLSKGEVNHLLVRHELQPYPNFIEKTFEGIYFTNEENTWLDIVNTNVASLQNPYKKALAQFALFQACLIKRPYNLFHRANLYMRTASVQRSFGNKTSWDTPFETHFREFVQEANAAVFNNSRDNKAIQVDALETPIGHDLVYIDSPYLNKKGVGVDYADFYHFLEGLVHYSRWGELIDYNSKHLRLKRQSSQWHNAKMILEAFNTLIKRHHKSILVISYRDDGIPTKEQLITLLRQYKNHVYEATIPQKYALAHKKNQELLLIAQ